MTMRLQLDFKLLFVVLLLLVFGVPMVFSASHLLAFRVYGTANYFVQRQLIFLGCGIAVMVIASQFPYQWYQKVSVPLMLVTLALLAALALFGSSRNGATRWAYDGSIQPSEFAKLATVIYVAHWLTSRRDRLHHITYGFLPFLLIVGMSAGLIVLQPDLSTGVVLVFTTMAMYFVAGAPILQLVVTLMGVVSIATALLYFVPWRLARFLIFLDPFRDRTGEGYQIFAMLLAMAGGRWLGHGFASITGTVGYLPASHTDAIFAVIGNDFGFAGCTFVIVLFTALGWRGMVIARNAPDQFGFLLATGITVWLTGQALLNIASTTSSIPFTGIPLPFISLGGSALVTSMGAIGILLNIALASRRARALEPRAAIGAARMRARSSM